MVVLRYICDMINTGDDETLVAMNGAQLHALNARDWLQDTNVDSRTSLKNQEGDTIGCTLHAVRSTAAQLYIIRLAWLAHICVWLIRGAPTFLNMVARSVPTSGFCSPYCSQRPSSHDVHH